MKKIISFILVCLAIFLVMVEMLSEYTIRLILYLPVKYLFHKNIIMGYPPLFFYFMDWIEKE